MRAETASRPRQLVVVVGTGTDVGKTWAASRLLQRWRAAGRVVAARKPAQSFEPGDDIAARTDAHVLAAASGEEPDTVCPPRRWYPLALAPPMAADALDRGWISVDDLIGELAWPEPVADIGLVETVGGVRSPIAHDGDALGLIDALAPDAVVLIADAGLGTLNAVQLSIGSLATVATPPGAEPVPVRVVLNRFDATCDLHLRNRAWLDERLTSPCFTELDSLADGFMK
jgi:dethiobiotin synthetase